jgi:predicted RNA-binding Zn ribbon-like protein
VVKNARLEALKVNGNRLCLDFLNTIYHRYKPTTGSYILDAEDLVYWGREKVGIAGGAACQPADGIFEEAMHMRTVLDGVFYPISQKTAPTKESMDAFNRIQCAYRAHEIIQHDGQCFKKTYDWEITDPRRILSAIMSDAVDLLMGPKLDRVGACARCGWVFLDTSKCGNRRWCSMEECGSCVKAGNYYHRNKAGD